MYVVSIPSFLLLLYLDSVRVQNNILLSSLLFCNWTITEFSIHEQILSFMIALIIAEYCQLREVGLSLWPSDQGLFPCTPLGRASYVRGGDGGKLPPILAWGNNPHSGMTKFDNYIIHTYHLSSLKLTQLSALELLTTRNDNCLNLQNFNHKWSKFSKKSPNPTMAPLLGRETPRGVVGSAPINNSEGDRQSTKCSWCQLNVTLGVCSSIWLHISYNIRNSSRLLCIHVLMPIVCVNH